MTSVQAHEAIYKYLDESGRVGSDEENRKVTDELLALIFTPIYQAAYDKGYSDGQVQEGLGYDPPDDIFGDAQTEPGGAFGETQTEIGREVAETILERATVKVEK